MARATAKRGSRDGIEWRTDAKGVRSYRWVVNRSARAGGKVRGEWTRSHAEARNGRGKALGEIQAGKMARPDGATLRAEWEAFIAGAKTGAILDRTRTPYKPATLRGYERGWAKIDPEIGAHKMSAVRRADIQAMVDRWAAEGMAPATIRNTLNPLQAMYRRAVAADRIAVNPTTGLEIQKVENGRERVADPTEAVKLLGALPDGEQALWATAMYAGLRRGELRALRWSDVDLAKKRIAVSRSWDDNAGEQTPKTKAGRREVPIVPPLAAALKAHKKSTGRDGSDLVFGRTASEPFVPTTARSRALAAWAAADKARAKELGRALRDGEKLTPITLHECRHTCASLLIAAGANAKALSVVMGHASITITFDRYGHLMPGGVDEVGRLLGDYLKRAK